MSSPRKTVSPVASSPAKTTMLCCVASSWLSNSILNGSPAVAWMQSPSVNAIPCATTLTAPLCTWVQVSGGGGVLIGPVGVGLGSANGTSSKAPYPLTSRSASVVAYQARYATEPSSVTASDGATPSTVEVPVSIGSDDPASPVANTTPSEASTHAV